MTKAERIFKDTWYECKKHIEFWGFDKNIGFNNMIINDDDILCTRTFNDLQKQIERKGKEIQMARKYEVIDEETYKERIKVLWMVKKTLENSIKHEKEFQERLKAM